MAAWSFTSTAAARLGTVAVGIMVARLLGPHEFGTYVVAYMALHILVNVNDLGASLALVHWPGDPREAAPTVATISLGGSLLLYAGCYLGAPGYAAAMGAPAAAGVVRVLCLAVVADGLVASPAGLLQRYGRHDRRLIGDQVNVWLGALLTGALAWAGMGAMSLAAGRLAGCLAALVTLVASSPEPLRFGFRPDAARALLRSGLPLAGPAVVTCAVISAGQFVIGPVLGVTALGYFVLASNLSGWPVTLSTQRVRDAAPALFAQLRPESAAVRRAFVTVAGLAGAIALPVCLAVSGLAVPLIGFVYGQRWLPAAPALAWLAGLAGLQLAFEFGWGYLAVLARTRVVVTLQFVWLAVLVPALAAGTMTGGITGTARAEVAVAACLALPWYLWALRRTGISGRALASRLALPVAGAAVAGLTCVAASVLVPGQVPALAAGGTVSALVIGLLLYHLRGDLVVLLRRPRAQAGRDAQWAGVAGGRDAGWAGVPEGRELEWAGAAEGRDAQWGGVPPGLESGWAAAHRDWEPGWPGGMAGRDAGWAGEAGRDAGWAGEAGPDAGWAGEAGEAGPGWAGEAAAPGPGWADAAADPDPGWTGAPEGWDRDGAAAAGDRGPGWSGDAGEPGPWWVAAGAPVLPVSWPGLAARADATGPLPVCRAAPALDVPPPRAAPTMGRPLDRALPPLYRATARALGWEPRVPSAHGGPGDGDPDARGRARPGGCSSDDGEEDWLPADWHPDRW